MPVPGEHRESSASRMSSRRPAPSTEREQDRRTPEEPWDRRPEDPQDRRTPDAGANAGGAVSSSAPTSSSTASVTPSPGGADNAILTGLSRANDTSEARGLIPPRSCKAVRDTFVTCTHPSTFVSTASFTTYPSLRSVYSAYEATARRLSGRPFAANRGDCNRRQSSGEVSWNHDYEHPRSYSVAQLVSDKLSPSTEAAGRLFCTLDAKGFHIVWVQNDGRLLGTVEGSPHTDAFLWWRSVHHSLSLSGTDMSDMDMP
jgi:hypothetical protein